MRASGILMPIFSLPGRYGIGAFSEAAYRFVDFLESAGQKYWQILPLGPTSYGDSPYQSFSTFAGNPYFIDLDQLYGRGWLTQEELDREAEGWPEVGIDYHKLYTQRYDTLRLAFQRSNINQDPEFEEYVEANRDWLPDYALFMALKDRFGGVSFVHWEEKIRFRDPETLRTLEEEMQEEIRFQEFMQYVFHEHWENLRRYAGEHGVGFIGDIPIYVSEDSAEVWTHPELFKMDEAGNKVSVAGCPPDAFAVTGQLWGNPIYNWDAHRETGYDWWIRRLRACMEMFDVVRIDHFRGFESFYEIPAGDPTAERGVWTKGPGMDFFRAVQEALPDMKVIAEDLGFITDEVRQMVKDTGYPNMRVLEFAFDSNEPSGNSIYYPYNYDRNCVVYLGTHDNDPIVAWLQKFWETGVPQIKRYADVDTDDIMELARKMIILAHSSVADLCVLQMQDYLRTGAEGRINVPSTLGGNWMWRMAPGADSPELAARIADVTRRYGR